ncbi:MAG: hypothetical protein QXM53_05205 [Thermofilaceae archaeon]
MGPVEVANFGLLLWCCLFSFTFQIIIWAIPFTLIGYFLYSMFYSVKREQEVDFNWGEFFSNYILFLFLIIVIAVFIGVWDYLGVPKEYIKDTFVGTGNSTTGGSCFYNELSFNFECCNRLSSNVQSSIIPIMLFFIKFFIIIVKFLVIVGTFFLVFFWGIKKYNRLKPALESGRGNHAWVIIQATLSVGLSVFLLFIVFLFMEKLLFFNVREMIVNTVQCILQQR